MSPEQALEIVLERSRAATDASQINEQVGIATYRHMFIGLDVDPGEVGGLLMRGAVQAKVMIAAGATLEQASFGLMIQAFAVGYLMGSDS